MLQGYEYWFVNGENIGTAYHLPEQGWIIIFSGTLDLHADWKFMDRHGNMFTAPPEPLRSLLHVMLDKSFNSAYPEKEP